MDSLLIVVLVAFAAGVALSWRRPAPEPQIIYVVAEPEQRGGGGCLAPLVVAGIVVFLLFALR